MSCVQESKHDALHVTLRFTGHEYLSCLMLQAVPYLACQTVALDERGKPGFFTGTEGPLRRREASFSGEYHQIK